MAVDVFPYTVVIGVLYMVYVYIRMYINSSAPERCSNSFKYVIFKYIVVGDI